jgi:hypothetical protein
MIGKSTLLVIFVTAINAAVGFVVAPSRGMAQKCCTSSVGLPLSARALAQKGCTGSGGLPLSARSLDEEDSAANGTPSSFSPLPRREVLQVALSAVFFGASALPAVAAEEKKESTVYLTGKSPKVPGQKPKDKSDVGGTRKDPKFLRSLSDCKTRCETVPTSEGLARSKEDCLSECQDICCNSYEQCTFGIVPRI